MTKKVLFHLNEHKEVLNDTFSSEEEIVKASILMIEALKNDCTIFWCGNGGSASDSMHLAGELIGRFVGNRRPLKSLSLAADSSVLTCIANDFGYEEIFSRQLEGVGKKGDILIVISTSGMSKNILNVISVAKEKRIKTIGLLGKGGGKVKEKIDLPITIKSKSTARIQEMHIMIGHILCDLIEEGLNLK